MPTRPHMAGPSVSHSPTDAWPMREILVVVWLLQCERRCGRKGYVVCIHVPSVAVSSQILNPTFPIANGELQDDVLDPAVLRSTCTSTYVCRLLEYNNWNVTEQQRTTGNVSEPDCLHPPADSIQSTHRTRARSSMKPNVVLPPPPSTGDTPEQLLRPKVATNPKAGLPLAVSVPASTDPKSVVRVDVW